MASPIGGYFRFRLLDFGDFISHLYEYSRVSSKGHIHIEKCFRGSHLANMFLVGGFKSLGVLIVELTDVFEAPLAAVTVMLGLIGGSMSILSPLGTALGDRYTNRVVVMVGGVFMALGAFVTSFAVNMTMVIFTFGILTGFGYGLVFGPANVVIGQYFRKRRSLASGMAVAGGSIGQLLIPLILHKLIDDYGWRGALFIYSAIMLHVVMGAMLFRPLSFYEKKPTSNLQQQEQQQRPHSALTDNGTGSGTGSLQPATHGRHPTPPCADDMASDKLKPMLDATVNHGNGVVNRSTQEISTAHRNGSTALNAGVNGDAGGVQVTDAVSADSKYGPGQRYTSTGSLCFYPFDDAELGDEYLQARMLHDPGSASEHAPLAEHPRAVVSFVDVLRVSFCVRCLEENHGIPLRDSLFDWALFRNRLFLLYIVGVGLGNTGSINLFMFIPKHSEDLGFNRRDGALLLSIGGFCDLASRVAGGWFADLGLVRRSNIMAATILLMGLATLVFPQIASFSALVTYVMLVGTMGGVYAALFLVVLIDLVGLDRTPKAFGMTLMIMGLINMPMPILLGYLRDVTGDCRASFSVCGGLMVLCSICFFCEPIARRLEERRQARLRQQVDIVQ